MTITALEAIPFAYPETNDDRRTRYVCLVRLSTADRVSRWREAVTLFARATVAAREILEGLRPLVVGADPLDDGTVFSRLGEHTWWYGRGGIASMAIAAIDIALWDLRGKLSGQRVVDLLGGPVQERLPAIV